MNVRTMPKKAEFERTTRLIDQLILDSYYSALARYEYKTKKRHCFGFVDDFGDLQPQGVSAAIVFSQVSYMYLLAEAQVL